MRRTLELIGVLRPTFYRWYDHYQGGGREALRDRPFRPSRVLNRIPDGTRQQILALVLGKTELSPPQAGGALPDTTDYVIAWKLCTTMTAEDVTATLEVVLEASGCGQSHVHHKPRLLSDNGPSYIAGELAHWLNRNMSRVRRAPYHPQTQGKIERWQQTLKNSILLENYYLPGDLEAEVEAFVDHRDHESLENLTFVDVYFGRAAGILAERARTKRHTAQHWRLQLRKLAP